jgi:hypothetical protein
VQGRDIALNTVTGEDVKEDTLQKVPSALLADSATSASTAEGVATLKIIPVTTVAAGATPVTLATHGPLTLSADCATGTATARLFVSTAENNSSAGGNGTGSFQDGDVDSTDGPVKIGEADGMTNPAYIPITTSAFTPSGKGFSGEVAMYRDTVAGTCRFHGSLALQG